MSKVRIDTAVNMAYVWVEHPLRKVATTVPMQCNVDYDEYGNIIGIELFLPVIARGDGDE